MKEWIIKYWIEALFGLIITVIIAGYKRLSNKVTNKTKKQDAIKLGIQALLRDCIIRSYNHYMDMGYCPIYALENVMDLYKPYHDLDGNGTVTGLVERLKELPTEKQERE